MQYFRIVRCNPIITNTRVCGGSIPTAARGYGVGCIPQCPPALPPVDHEPTLCELIELHLRSRVWMRLEEHRAWQELSDEVALERAMLGQDARGYKHDHQRRLVNAALRMALRLAADRRADFFEPKVFEPILAATRRIQAEVFGLGAMWGYDAAERLAAHRGITPTELVYLQRGALVGARNLGLRVYNGIFRHQDLPPQLRLLDAADVEDFLCVNKHALHAGMLDDE